MKRQAILFSCFLIVAGCGDDSAHGVGGGVCGDGVVTGEEVCDDGNVQDGDGCSRDCLRVEDGFDCPDGGGACAAKPGGDEPGGDEPGGDEPGGDEPGGDEPGGDEPYCGDYEVQVDAGEVCDNGDNNIDGEYGIEGDCTRSCQKAKFCGDGIVSAAYGEQCDEGMGNGEGAYGGCSLECKRVHYCGDGVVDAQGGEQCDDGNALDGDGCSSKCVYEEGFVCFTNDDRRTVCTPVSCGNGKIEPEMNEVCDDGNRESGDGCSASCQGEKGWRCVTGADGMSKCENVCGNGVVDVDAGETCDDGNLADGDGCNGRCQTEAGWLCQTVKEGEALVTQACVARACGDGFLAGNEACDDGNLADGDGCSRKCRVEAGYLCLEPGKPCVKGVCGDGVVQAGEACDDGNLTNGDGCSSVCQLEAGYRCLKAGGACEAQICGDGVISVDPKYATYEECDLGAENGKEGSGCDGTCRILDGYHCDVEGKACEKGACGNGILDKGEACDDGNTLAGDGCSPICEIEPIFECTGVTCRPTCGDGLTLFEAGEECDDGNLINGDGCSSDCKIEKGYQCTSPKPSSEWPTVLNLPITYRDFVRYHGKSVPANQTPMEDGFVSKELYDSLPDSCKGVSNGYRAAYPLEIGHPSPDFYSYCPDSRCLNAVLDTLDGDGKPVLNEASKIVSTDGHEQVACNYLYTCPEVFRWWYRDVPGINKRYEATLQFKHLGEGRYDFSPDGAFLPLKNLKDVEGGEGYTRTAGYGEFTSEFHTYFKYSGGETLNFSGDDDVWVFFNRRLGVDVGGIHPEWQKSINLDEHAERLHMFKGGIYALDMFHAERCLGGSNFHLTLAGFMQMGRSTCVSVCGDGIIAGEEQCDPCDQKADPECSAQFVLESGCNPTTCQLQAYCGNGKIEMGEQCDSDESWCKGCKLDPDTCGNGVLDAHEQCDCDGGRCFSDTKKTIEVACNPATCRIIGCGDGILDVGEECDDGNKIDDDACTNACTRPKCGDHIVQSWMGEVCDDGSNDGAYGHCGLGCTYLAPRCGDGVVDQYNGEVCDDGVNSGAYGTCNPDCTLAPHCGDGIVQGEFESCDEGENNGKGRCSLHCSITIN